MARLTQKREFESTVPSRDGEVVSSFRKVPVAYELYGDTTVRAGADGLGIRLQLGPYQLLFVK